MLRSVETSSAPEVQLPKPAASLPKWRAGSLRPIWKKALDLSVKWRGETFPLIDAVLDPVWFWQLFGTYEGEPIVFEDWQVAHLHDGSRYRAREKAPQIGFSWLSALEAEWDCLMFEDATDGFVSVDQREASEKVLYAHKAYDELPDFIKAWVPLVKNSTEELWFGDAARPSRLMSIPATSALRGRKMSVYLDEVDFYRDGGKDAHRIAMTRVTRGGRVTMGSTCFGVDTQLDNTMQKGKNFSKARLPYTVATQPEIIEAILIAKEELDEADFDEEYCCVRGGGGAQTFSPDLIRRVQHELGVFDRQNLPKGPATILGYDVSGGTGRHPAILTALVHDGDGQWRQRCIEEMRDERGAGLELPEQEKALREVMDALPAATLVIDAQGVGLQISQSLKNSYGERVIFMKPGSKPEGLEPQDRKELVTEVKRVLEAGEVEIAPDKDQAIQLRRTRIINGTVDQPGSKKKTHYDKFWSLAYAIYGIRNSQRESVYEKRGLLIVGGKNATGFSGRRLQSVT